jgi:hypothetical protein
MVQDVVGVEPVDAVPGFPVIQRQIQVLLPPRCAGTLLFVIVTVILIVPPPPPPLRRRGSRLRFAGHRQ